MASIYGIATNDDRRLARIDQESGIMAVIEMIERVLDAIDTEYRVRELTWRPMSEQEENAFDEIAEECEAELDLIGLWC